MAVQDQKARKYEVAVEDKDKPSSNILFKLKDPAFRSKFLRWIWQPCVMFTLGIVISQGGPTVLDLQIITGVDDETGSFFFTSISGGYLVGSFVAGGVHGKVSNNLVMTVVTLLGGAATIATPYCSAFALMICVRAIAGFFLASIDCSINAETMRVWGNEGQSLLMFVHFSFAIGGVIGPAFSAPFLAEKIEENKTATQQYPNVTQIPMKNHTEAQTLILPQTTDVHYAYLISGIILFLASIPFIVMLIFCIKPKVDEEKSTEESQQRKIPISLQTFLCVVLCAYYVMYCCAENTFSSFLETFLVKEFKGTTKAKAAYITTYFWAAFAAGRFAAIFTSQFVVAVRLLYMQFCLLIIALIGFLVGAHYNNLDVVTGFTCLIGVALSSMYPSGFSWTEAEILKVTGIISGVILVGSSIGSMLSPYIVGYLMQNVTSLWFSYFLAGSAAVTGLLFLFLLCFNRLYVNRKYGKFEHTTEQEKEDKVSPNQAKSKF
jgi:FHS family Na+ dependent glucose MFS transporter 1